MDYVEYNDRERPRIPRQPDVIEAAARLAPGEHRPSLREIARRAQAFKESVDQAYLERIGPVLETLKNPSLTPEQRARLELDKAEADLERAQLIRTVRDVATADAEDTEAVAARRLDALVPARFRGVGFDDYAPRTRSQRVALEAAREFVERTRGGDSTMLALLGPTGTGKSHLLYAALQAVVDLGNVYTRSWNRLADDLRYGGQAAYAPKNAPLLEAPDVRRQLYGAQRVFIDEVRPTANTAFDDTELAKFACHAYDAALAVFITTNVSPLENVMGPAAASRFTQVVMEGSDHRHSSDLEAPKTRRAVAADDLVGRYRRVRLEGS
jgi:DNA replication protein DnaC